MVEQNPSISSRAIASEVGVSQSSALRTMQDDDLHPYHIMKVQKLSPEDYEPRLNFSRWYLDSVNADPLFENRILWTDEATFSQDGKYNIHNSHIWAHENPHAVQAVRSQWRFSVNIWAGNKYSDIHRNLVGR